ncbi:mannosyltransferase family protein [Cohnella faecalis]|uniref:mannosyltransferase family protein n=2 Tax=Cohnella faecalis TaxID=2315694 RepID=UPI003622E566
MKTAEVNVGSRASLGLARKREMRWWVWPVLVNLIILVAATYLPYFKSVAKDTMEFGDRAHFWFQWDSLWYMDIANNGYQDRKATAFFPFLPLLIRVLSNPYLVLLANQIAFVCCLHLLKKFFVRMNLNASQTRTAIWLFVLNPAAIYYSTLYTELWTVLFSLASLEMAAQKKWGWAALFAAILSSTRATALTFGFFPLALLVYSVLRADWKTSLRALLWGGSLLIGLLAYMTYLNGKFGDPFAFSATQSKDWDHYWVLPWKQVIEGLKDAMSGGIQIMKLPLLIVSLLFAFWGAVTIWKVPFRRAWHKWGAVLFVLSGILLTFSFGTENSPMHSTFRYLSVFFPVYAAIAVIRTKQLRWLIVAGFAGLSFAGAWAYTHSAWYL